MPGYNPGLPDIDENDPKQRKYWRYYFVYGVGYWVVLASILIYAFAIGSVDGNFTFAWIALFLLAVPLLALAHYLYRMYAVLRHWQKSKGQE